MATPAAAGMPPPSGNPNLSRILSVRTPDLPPPPVFRNDDLPSFANQQPPTTMASSSTAVDAAAAVAAEAADRESFRRSGLLSGIPSVLTPSRGVRPMDVDESAPFRATPSPRHRQQQHTSSIHDNATAGTTTTRPTLTRPLLSDPVHKTSRNLIIDRIGAPTGAAAASRRPPASRRPILSLVEPPLRPQNINLSSTRANSSNQDGEHRTTRNTNNNTSSTNNNNSNNTASINTRRTTFASPIRRTFLRASDSNVFDRDPAPSSRNVGRQTTGNILSEFNDNHSSSKQQHTFAEGHSIEGASIYQDAENFLDDSPDPPAHSWKTPRARFYQNRLNKERFLDQINAPYQPKTTSNAAPLRTGVSASNSFAPENIAKFSYAEAVRLPPQTQPQQPQQPQQQQIPQFQAPQQQQQQPQQPQQQEQAPPPSFLGGVQLGPVPEGRPLHDIYNNIGGGSAPSVFNVRSQLEAISRRLLFHGYPPLSSALLDAMENATASGTVVQRQVDAFRDIVDEFLNSSQALLTENRELREVIKSEQDLREKAENMCQQFQNGYVQESIAVQGTLKDSVDHAKELRRDLAAAREEIAKLVRDKETLSGELRRSEERYSTIITQVLDKIGSKADVDIEAVQADMHRVREEVDVAGYESPIIRIPKQDLVKPERRESAIPKIKNLKVLTRDQLLLLVQELCVRFDVRDVKKIPSTLRTIEFVVRLLPQTQKFLEAAM